MNRNGLLGSRQLAERDAGRRSNGESGRLAGDAREPSLLELLSLSHWRRFVPETLFLLLLIALARTAWPHAFANGGSMPDPFWIPVLLMSGQYGIMGGLFAALAASGSLFISGLPPQSATQDFYAYAGIVAAQPCAWLATALAMGGLRTLHIHRQTGLQERLDHARTITEDLAGALERAIAEIALLEGRVASDCGTLASLFHGLAQLNFADRRSLVESFVDLIRYGVGATNLTIYLDLGNGLEPCLCIEGGNTLAPVPGTALPASLFKAIQGEDAGARPFAEAGGAGLPCWMPVRVDEAAKPAGAIICSQLEPSRNAAVAVRQLMALARLLAALLSSCPEGRTGARAYADE